MRPPGEVRQALRAWRPGADAPGTWRDAAAWLARERGAVLGPAELRLVQRTLENMVRAGELAPVAERVSVPGARRRLQAYVRVLEPAVQGQGVDAPGAPGALLAAWFGLAAGPVGAAA